MGYLNFFQTLEKLKSIPETYQPQETAQLSNACINKKITPVFEYNAFSLINMCGTGENTEYINIPIIGYLTDETLPNVFNWSSRREKKIEFTTAIIYELVQKEEYASKGDRIVLAKKTFHQLRPLGNPKTHHFDLKATWNTRLYSSSNEKDAERIRALGGIEISQNDLLFPIEHVEDYVDSFICEYEENHLSSLSFDSSAANAKAELQKQEIKRLQALVEQMKSDHKDQLSKQADTPADDKELNPKDSAYCLIAVLKNLLLNTDITSFYFQTDNDKGKKHPTQEGLASHIDDMQIPSILGDNVKILFTEANKKLKDANQKADDKRTKS